MLIHVVVCVINVVLKKLKSLPYLLFVLHIPQPIVYAQNAAKKLEILLV